MIPRPHSLGLARVSLDPTDQIEGHIGGIDALARAFLCAAALWNIVNWFA